MFVIKQNPNLYISVNLSVFTKLQSTYQERYGGKITLKINLNVTRGDSLGELFWLGTYWLPSSRSITLQVITAAWRLWWRGGQMWIWTSLTWARRSTRPASAKSWSVPGHSWGKVSRRQCVDLYIHAHTRLMGAFARIDTHRWENVSDAPNTVQSLPHWQEHCNLEQTAHLLAGISRTQVSRRNVSLRIFEKYPTARWCHVQWPYSKVDRKCQVHINQSGLLERVTETLLICASMFVFGFVAVLLAGASVQKGKFLDSPLHAAAEKDCTAVVKLLLDFGADINARNTECQRPVEVAPPSSLTEGFLLLYEGTGALYTVPFISVLNVPETQLMYCFGRLSQQRHGCWASCVVSASGTASAVIDFISLTISPCPPDSGDSCCTNDRRNRVYA